MPVLYLGGDASGIKTGAAQAVSSLNMAAKSADKAKRSMDAFGKSVAGAAKQVLALVEAENALAGVKGFIQRGIAFNKAVESATTDLAALIAAMARLEDAGGIPLEGLEKHAAAQGLAAAMVRETQQLGTGTAATTRELLQGLQAVTGPALQAGMTLRDIPRFAVAGARALESMGIPLQRLGTELEALLTGSINQTHEAAPRLGIDAASVERWKQQGIVADALLEKLKVYEDAGRQSVQTWQSLSDGLAHALDLLAGYSAAGLTADLKAAVQEMQTLLMTTENGGPRISEDFQHIADVLRMLEDAVGEALLSGVKRLSEALGSLNAHIAATGGAAIAFDRLAAAIQVAAVALGALVVARKAAAAQTAVDVAGVKDGIAGLWAHAKASYEAAKARSADAQAAKAAAGAELEAANAALAAFRAKGQTAVATREAGAAELARLAVLRQEKALVDAVAAAEAKRAAASQAVHKASLAARGLGNVVSGGMSLFGGPFGLALTAAATGFAALASRQTDAEKAATLHRHALQSLRGAMQDTQNEAGQLSHTLDALGVAQAQARRLDLKKAYDHQRKTVTTQLDALIRALGVIDGGTSADQSLMRLEDAEQLKNQAEAFGSYTETIKELREQFTRGTIEGSKLQEELTKIDTRMRGKGQGFFSSSFTPLIDAAGGSLTALRALNQTMQDNERLLKNQAVSALQEAKTSEEAAKATTALDEALRYLSATRKESLQGGDTFLDRLLTLTAHTQSAQKALKEKTRAEVIAHRATLNNAEIQAQLALQIAIANAAMEKSPEAAKAMLAEAEGNLEKIKKLSAELGPRIEDFLAGRTGGTSGGISFLESAKKEIKDIRREIQDMNRQSPHAVPDLVGRLEEIAEAGKKARLSPFAITALQHEYSEAVTGKVVAAFNREILKLEGNMEALRELDAQDALRMWAESFTALGFSAEQSAFRIERLREAFARADAAESEAQVQKKIATKAAFYKELAALSGDDSIDREYWNQSLQKQAEEWESNGIAPEDIRQRMQLMYQEISRDPFDGLIRGARTFGMEYADMAARVEGFTRQMGQTISDSLASAFMTGKFSAGDFFQSLIGYAAQAASNAFIGKIFSGVSGLLGGPGAQAVNSGTASFSGGGFVSQEALTQLLPKLSFWEPFPMAHGGLARPLRLPSSGGVLTSPALFYDGMNKAYASGGLSLAGEAGPEVFMPAVRLGDGNYGVRVELGGLEYGLDESVRRARRGAEATADSLRSLLGRGYGDYRGVPEVTVNVINQTGSQVTAQSQLTADGNGGFTMEILLTQVEQGLVSRARSGRSALMQYQEKAYGLSRAGVLARGRR